MVPSGDRVLVPAAHRFDLLRPSVTPIEGAAIIAAGAAASTINTIVGSGSLITFPTLLALGYPPVVANVSNTIGLVPGSASGTFGYRRELTGQRGRGIQLGALAVAGGLTGGLLLLALPATAFERIVPFLILAAVVLVIIQPQLARRMARRRANGSSNAVGVWASVFFTGIYGGYFGAAQGVVLMGVFGILLAEPLQRQNGLKNLMAGLVNLVAAIVFSLTAEVDWAAAGLIALGAMIGGVIGARIGRRLPPAALRAVIVVVGVAAIVKLLL